VVEAAGVEPDINVENNQLADSDNVSIARNAAIFKSSVQIAYKDFPELQNFQGSLLRSPTRRSTLLQLYIDQMKIGISPNSFQRENTQTLSTDECGVGFSSKWDLIET